MTEACVRFFAPIFEWTAFQAPPLANYWAFRAWRYCLALQGAPVMGISSVGAFDMGNELSPWYELREIFYPRPVADRYVNVVCGIGKDISKLFTVGPGVKNVALTGLIYGSQWQTTPKEDEIEALKCYNRVLCPTPGDVSLYAKKYGITAQLIAPDDLWPIFKEILDERDEQADQ